MVNINTGVPQTAEDAELAAWGILEGRSMPSLKFTQETPPGSKNYIDLPVGTFYEGTVAEPPRAVQATDFDTKQPKTYQDGTPIMEILLVLDCPQLVDGTDPDDDGKRQTRLGQYGKRALQDEMQAKGIKSFGPGTKVRIEFTGYKANKSGRPSKLFSITLSDIQPFVPAAQRKVEQAIAQPVQAAQQPVQAVQQPVQPVAQPQPQPQMVQQPQAVQQAAPAAGIVVTQAHVDKVNHLLSVGIERATAIEAVAGTDGAGSEEFKQALANEIPF